MVKTPKRRQDQIVRVGRRKQLKKTHNASIYLFKCKLLFLSFFCTKLKSQYYAHTHKFVESLVPFAFRDFDSLTCDCALNTYRMLVTGYNLV